MGERGWNYARRSDPSVIGAQAYAPSSNPLELCFGLSIGHVCRKSGLIWVLQISRLPNKSLTIFRRRIAKLTPEGLRTTGRSQGSRPSEVPKHLNRGDHHELKTSDC